MQGHFSFRFSGSEEQPKGLCPGQEGQEWGLSPAGRTIVRKAQESEGSTEPHLGGWQLAVTGGEARRCSMHCWILFTNPSVNSPVSGHEVKVKVSLAQLPAGHRAPPSTAAGSRVHTEAALRGACVSLPWMQGFVKAAPRSER